MQSNTKPHEKSNQMNIAKISGYYQGLVAVFLCNAGLQPSKQGYLKTSNFILTNAVS